MYVKQAIDDAAREALELPGHPSPERSYEIDEAIYVLRAALGMPIPRQACDVCGARDSIYWSKYDSDPPEGLGNCQMWCHVCRTISPTHTTVMEPAPER